MPDNNKCPLCNRELAEPMVRHHLIPPSKGGKDTPTVVIHKICQAKVHAVFTETELKNYYHTVDRIKEHEDIIKFIKWVSKKELEFFDNTIKRNRNPAILSFPTQDFLFNPLFCLCLAS